VSFPRLFFRDIHIGSTIQCNVDGEIYMFMKKIRFTYIYISNSSFYPRNMILDKIKKNKKWDMKGSYDQSICSSLLLHFCFLFSFFSLCFFFFCIFLVTLFPLSIFYAFFLLYKYLESRFSFLLVMEMDFDAFFHSSSWI